MGVTKILQGGLNIVLAIKIHFCQKGYVMTGVKLVFWLYKKLQAGLQSSWNPQRRLDLPKLIGDYIFSSDQDQHLDPL